MKKTIIFLIAIVLTAHVSAQKPTVDMEKQEAARVAKILADSLWEGKNVLPVLKSLAVKDFIQRHIDDSTNYALGFVSRDLAKSLSHDELWRYYALTLSFDYYKASYAATLGYFGPPEEGTKDEREHKYPPGIEELNKRLYLAKEDPTIETRHEFRRHMKHLSLAVDLFRDYITKHPVGQSAMYQRNLEYLANKKRYFHPSVGDREKTTFGFQPGTRFYGVNVPFLQIRMVNTEGEMKIINIASSY